MDKGVKKGVFSLTETDEAFLPLTAEVPRELLPLAGRPLIEHMIEGVLRGGAEELIFISSSRKKRIESHFTRQDPEEKHNYRFAVQKKKTDGAYTLSRAEREVGEDPFFFVFPHYLLHGKKSAAAQLSSVFRTSQKPVAALFTVQEESKENYLFVETEKIANRFYKIKKVLDNWGPQDTESCLALAGVYIFTPSIFDFVRNASSDMSLAESLNNFIASGKTIYGHEPEGEWLPLRDKLTYLKAQLKLSLYDDTYGEELINYVKEIL